MKTLKIKLLAIVLLSCFSAMAQTKNLNLDKLPHSKRDSILIDIAKTAVLKYSEGYYREGDTPTIKDLGVFKAESKHKEYDGIKIYSVSYPLTAKEKAFHIRAEALITVTITADIGKSINIEFVDGFGAWIADDKAPFRRRYIPVEKWEQMARDMVKVTTINDFTGREDLTPEQLVRRIKSDSIRGEVERRKRESIERRRIEDSLRNVPFPELSIY